FFLGFGNQGIDVGFVTDFAQHVQNRFASTTVSRAPQCGNTGSDTGERVGTGRAGQTHSRSRSVLFVVSVQQENTIHSTGDDRADFLLFTGGVEHHVQEVFSVRQLDTRVYERLTDGIFVNHGRQCWHYGDQTVSRNQTVMVVMDIQRVMIKSRQGADNATHNGHRVCITTEAIKEVA